MRIAFAYDVPYPWHIGGIEMLNYNEAEELARENQVHFFTMKWPGMKDEFEYKKIKYHAQYKTDQEMIYRHGRRSVREAIKYSFSLFRLFGYDFDCVVANAFPFLHLPLVRLYCRIKGARYIIEVAEVWDEKYWNSYLGPVLGSIAYLYTRFAMSGADRYITISSDTTSRLVNFGIQGSRISMFAPAIDNSAIERINREKIPKTNTIMFSGRLIKEKRLDVWLDVFADAYSKDDSLRGLIIGNGPEKAAIKRMIRERRLTGKVVTSDFFKSNLDLYRQMKGSLALLHTSEREGLGIIALESLMLGTPVLLPDYTPIPEEISGMCITAEKGKLPDYIIRIKAGKYTVKTDPEKIDLFSKSHVKKFFSELLKKQG